MKTKYKLIQKCFLSVVLLLPAAVQAQFIYTTNNGAITITKYTGPGGAVVIPATPNGYPVTAIGTNAFQRVSNPMTVTIPNSVTSIGASAISDRKSTRLNSS